MIKKAFHDRLFLVTTFPIALLAFEFVRWTIFDGGFLPFTVLLLLLLLSVAEPFAAKVKGSIEGVREEWR